MLRQWGFDELNVPGIPDSVCLSSSDPGSCVATMQCGVLERFLALVIASLPESEDGPIIRIKRGRAFDPVLDLPHFNGRTIVFASDGASNRVGSRFGITSVAPTIFSPASGEAPRRSWHLPSYNHPRLSA